MLLRLLRKSGELFQSSPKLDDIDVQGCNNPGLELANAFGVRQAHAQHQESSSQQLATTGFQTLCAKPDCEEQYLMRLVLPAVSLLPTAVQHREAMSQTLLRSFSTCEER
jgi:hypothetical protein